jgi:hypothetical protein
MATLALAGCKNLNDDGGHNQDGNQNNIQQHCGDPIGCNEKTRQSYNKIIDEQRELYERAGGVGFNPVGITACNYIARIYSDKVHSWDGGMDWALPYGIFPQGTPDRCYSDADRKDAEDYARTYMAYREQ